MDERRFVGFDREVEIPLTIGEFAEQARRGGQGGIVLNGLPQVDRRIRIAALKMRGHTGAQIQNGITGTERQRLAERRGGPVRVTFVDRLPTGLRKLRNRRLRRHADRAQHEQAQYGRETVAHNLNGSNDCARARLAPFVINRAKRLRNRAAIGSLVIGQILPIQGERRGRLPRTA